MSLSRFLPYNRIRVRRQRINPLAAVGEMRFWNFVFSVATVLALLASPGNAARAVEVLAGGKLIELEKTLPDVEDLWVTSEDFTKINGFVIKPEGACYESVCIPLRQDHDSDLFVRRDGQSWFNASAFADKVQQAYVVDRDAKVWSFGLVPDTRKAFLDSAIAPDFELKDRAGNLVKLSDFRGKKVLIITWASW